MRPKYESENKIKNKKKTQKNLRNFVGKRMSLIFCAVNELAGEVVMIAFTSIQSGKWTETIYNRYIEKRQKKRYKYNKLG